MIIPVRLNVRLIFLHLFWFENSMGIDKNVNISGFYLMNLNLWQNNLTLPKV
jgi:hypothetical protein